MAKERNARWLDRPLSARSTIASFLLGTHPPRMRAAGLVRVCGALGIAEGTTRVALSRMVDRGELRLAAGTYELVGRVRDRQRTQDWSLTPRTDPWDGTWRLAVVRPTARAAGERRALRGALRRLRLAELREGCWTRPDNLPGEAAPADARAAAEHGCTLWAGRPDDDAETLASRLFDHAGWSARAATLADALASTTRTLATSDGTLAQPFALGAAALAHVRADPLLPAALVADTTSGAALRAEYARYQGAFADAVRRLPSR